MKDEHLDGTGGGFGRYKGIPISEIERHFDRCRQEGGMRGVSAVLRITREQLDARGGIGSYPWLAAVCLGAAAVIWLFPYREGPLNNWRIQGTISALFLFVLFGWTAFNTRVERRRGLYQEVKIRELATQALLDITQTPDFLPKPLDYTQRLTLERLLRKSKARDPALVSLLEQ